MRTTPIQTVVLSLLICFAWLTSFQTFAQPNKKEKPLAELVVTGVIINKDSLYPDITRDYITAEEIAVLQPATVTTLLRRIPGVDVTQQGGEGGLTFISIRGGDPNFTVVMIDGVKVDDPTNTRGGGYDFAGLDPLMIERIDVYPGSYSAVYGSDALGGTIGIRTKSSASSNTGTLEYGSSDGWAGALNLSAPMGDLMSGSFAVTKRKGSDKVDGDSLDRHQLSLKLKNLHEYNAGLDWSLNFFYSDTDSTAYPIASGGDQLAVIRVVEERDFDQLVTSGRIAWSPMQNWDTRFAAGWSRYEEHNDSPGIAPGVLSGIPPILTDSQYDRAHVFHSNTLTLTDSLSVGLGAEYILENGEIASVIDFGFPLPADFSQRRNTWAVFGETTLNINEQISLLASLRHDDAENINATNGRITANFDIDASDTSLSVSYAEGFKLPSLFALGHALTGNPDLEPEHSESVALDIQQPLEKLHSHLSFRLYRNEFRNLVDFDGITFTHVNRKTATTKGLDIAIYSNISEKLKLDVNVSYLYTHIGDGARLERRPKWKGNFTMSWRPDDNWLLMLDGHVNGEFHDFSVPTGTVLLDSFADLDVNIQRKITEKILLKLFIDNLFNSAYEESVGFSTPGREARFALSFQF